MVNFTTAVAALLTLAVVGSAHPNSSLFAHQSDVSCLDGENNYFTENGLVSEAVERINDLESRGTDACVAGTSTSFCRRGDTQTTGIFTKAASEEDSAGTTTTTCQDIAQAAGRVMDLCSRGNGDVKGQTFAFANTEMLVDIRSVAELGV